MATLGQRPAATGTRCASAPDATTPA